MKSVCLVLFILGALLLQVSGIKLKKVKQNDDNIKMELYKCVKTLEECQDLEDAYEEFDEKIGKFKGDDFVCGGEDGNYCLYRIKETDNKRIKKFKYHPGF